MGIVGVSSAHPLPLLLYSPSPCQVVEAPPSSDVEMSEVVMWNGNKRIQTQVRLRLREGGRGRGEGGGGGPRGGGGQPAHTDTSERKDYVERRRREDEER